MTARTASAGRWAPAPAGASPSSRAARESPRSPPECSAQTWQAQLQTCGDMDLVEGAQSASRFVGYRQSGQNENLVLFRTQLCSAVVPGGDPCVGAGTCGNTHDCWDHGATIVALTTSSYVISTGELVDADVEMNVESATPTLPDSPPCRGSSSTTTRRTARPARPTGSTRRRPRPAR